MWLLYCLDAHRSPYLNLELIPLNRVFAISFALWLCPLSACTDVSLVAFGEPGEVCKATTECVVGLECTGGLCTDPDQPIGDVTEDVVEADVLLDVSTSDASEVTEDSGDTGEVQPSPDTDITPSDVADALGDGSDGGVTDGQGDGSPTDVSPEDVVDTTQADGADTSEEVSDTSSDAALDVPADVEPIGPGLDEPCTTVCDVGLVCLNQVDGGGLCKPFPFGLCAPCLIDTDCASSGAQCKDFPGGGSFCGSPCATSANCPSGFICGAGQCVPLSESCLCTPQIQGSQLGCSTQNEIGTCQGQVVCQPVGWSACTAKLAIEELCDGLDNDCDGVTDEAPTYLENGQSLQVGVGCGIGACAGGEVICAPDLTATCSTNSLAAAEACADNIDNDCDGELNEGCTSLDYDGDGVPNDVDCAPTDSSYYQAYGDATGAPETCCPSFKGDDPECDNNCDGQVIPCAPCDTDSDGFCEPDDCSTLDPTTYPGAPEICNDGVDQDCQSGDLLCQPGQDGDLDGYVPPADCNDINPSVYPWAPEYCDNLDNDCDGTIDEGNPEAGQPCGVTEEYCVSGSIVCTHYGFGAAAQCQGAVLKSPEICDGIDNDCNGAIDEAWPDLGQACDGPDSDVCSNGVIVCTIDGSGSQCGEEALGGIIETCNDLDDDCDGATDEFVCPLHDLDGDQWTVEAGDCDDHRAEVYPNAPEPCCDTSLSPEIAAKTCDHDCDGIYAPCAVDDQDADGVSVSAGDCDDTDPQAYPGAPEKCGDGIDQDCFGGDLLCSAIPDTDNDGFHVGVDCNPNDQAVNPWAPETCNYADDDCDGLIDEGNPTVQVGSCGGVIQGCQPGDWVCVHDPKTFTVQELCVSEAFQADELCNDLDDDCDGSIDETFYDLGLPCDGIDPDLCENGQISCSEDGLGVACGGENVVNILEFCDSTDNDCDGLIDEGLTYDGQDLGDFCQGVGSCGAGITSCNAQGVPTCSTNPDGAFSQAGPELCDGLDNDCNGSTDEAYSVTGVFVGQSCDGVGACGVGIMECLNLSAAVCSTSPGGSASQASTEVCDGLDNDCDGHVDEDLKLEDSPCTAVGVCEDGGVVAKCKLASWVCTYDSIVGYEVEELSCDGLDNDCDGEIDEGYGVGEACDGPDEDLCQTGVLVCDADADADAVTCGVESEPNKIESCNEIDDDCDGITDETSMSPGAAGCSLTGVCAASEFTVVLCNGEGFLCDYTAIVDYEASETLCDGVDNDCDGFTDEGLFLGELQLGAACEGTGACADGFVECSTETLTPVCSTGFGGSEDQTVPEICNGDDEDCDGEIDEDFTWNGTSLGQGCNGEGACGIGVVECHLDASLALCSTEPSGSADESYEELCDGQDNDCDGFVDEDEELNGDLAICPDQGVCSGPNLQVSCIDGAWECLLDDLVGYESTEFLCDDQDNDCDGQIDEESPELGTPCDGDDPDTCLTGTWTCAPSGVGTECVNETGIIASEVCDGVDNDCDTFIDEGLLYEGVGVGQTCDGVGECAQGVVECLGDGGVTCSTNYDGSGFTGQTEACNGLDDDCDGSPDNGVLYQGNPLGAACAGVGVCSDGIVVCSNQTQEATCSTLGDGTTPETSVDDCNGQDDDCDGSTDESFSDFGAACDSLDDSDFCMTGYKACVQGEEKCFNDVACVAGGSCVDPGFPATHYCSCQALPCNVNAGDQCTDQGCRCNGGAPCTGFNKCKPGVGCE
jgi:Notch-like protein